MNKLSISIAVLAAAVSLSTPAQQGSAKPAGTIEQLRSCMSTQDDIEARQKALTDRGTELSKTTDALNAQVKEMAEEGQRAAEDPAASGRRTRYERKERAMKQEVEAHRKAQEAYGEERKKLETDFTAFRAKCADTAYLQDDIDKVKQERAAAGKK